MIEARLLLLALPSFLFTYIVLPILTLPRSIKERIRENKKWRGVRGATTCTFLGCPSVMFASLAHLCMQKIPESISPRITYGPSHLTNNLPSSSWQFVGRGRREPVPCLLPSRCGILPSSVCMWGLWVWLPLFAPLSLLMPGKLRSHSPQVGIVWS